MEFPKDREVVELAMNMAVHHIQNVLGQGDGGFADLHFTDFATSIWDQDTGKRRQLPEWSEMADRLLVYMVAERRNLARTRIGFLDARLEDCNLEGVDLYVRKSKILVEVSAGSPDAFPFMVSYAPACTWIGGVWLLTIPEWRVLESISLETEEVTFLDLT